MLRHIAEILEELARARPHLAAAVRRHRRGRRKPKAPRAGKPSLY
jgi:hypothetical protein